MLINIDKIKALQKKNGGMNVRVSDKLSEYIVKADRMCISLQKKHL